MIEATSHRATAPRHVPALGGLRRHVPALDGLRGFAALCVVVSHAGHVGIDSLVVAGTFGVSLFFTLSGFLMAYLYLGTNCTQAACKTYVVNRFSRIAPLYLLIVVSSLVIHGLIDPHYIYDINSHNLLRHLLFSGNDFVLWSIPPEVQFYGLFVLVWLAIDSFRAGHRLALLAMGVVIAAMLYLGPRAPGTTLPAECAFFLFGSAAGFAARRSVALPRGVIGLVQLVCLPATLLYCMALSGAGAAAVYSSLPYAALCAISVWSFAQEAAPGRAMFANKPMRKLGAWSFAIYLIHGPCIYVAVRLAGHGGWLVLAAGALATLPAAWLLHRGIERPAQRWMKRLAGRPPADAMPGHAMQADAMTTALSR